MCLLQSKYEKKRGMTYCQGGKQRLYIQGLVGNKDLAV